MNHSKHALSSAIILSIMMTAAGCSSSGDGDKGPDNNDGQNGGDINQKNFTVIQGTDLNTKSSALLSFNPGGPGGSPNQSQRAGDVLQAEDGVDSTLIGGLGVDVMLGASGDDILIGGTEDFNSSVDGDNKGADNRDRAFGNGGDDLFIWTPGDGSDFFDGGEGVDVLVLGVVGEQRDNNGATEGAPFFNVSPPGREGSQDFDGIFLDETNKPVVKVSTSPGFCTVIDKGEHAEELELLNLDHIVRFTLRGVAEAFEAGVRTDDDGLRVAISTKNVEYLVCAPKVTIDGEATDNIEVLDLTTTPPRLALLSELPEHIAQMIQ
ncbi:protein containing hemolysin-type calcium-binding repeats [Hahella chejuensis KCTC 2396]|uniref:Protein containing hemolysin-type calcium-binding repeats n=1 Tax=Hahella chejuensis (strain KCTC 2396) TaxID=349521 RepID=Q2SH86_HAHCH|nr:hypothetical protein [Hahella chejuensis]ABC29988.1 protein containing hemolysin-type calcium-binding repeats [Hahella chejuensis KCTC 2396]